MTLAAETQYIGNVVGYSLKGSVDDCIKKCNETKECNNFVYAKHKEECYFKDGILTGSEPVRSWDKQFSVYRSCRNCMYHHKIVVSHNQILLELSNLTIL